MSVFLDTNVLIYAVFDAPGSHAKHGRARDLLRGDDNVLSLQVLNEFVFQATKPTRAVVMTRPQAFSFVERLRAFEIVPLDLHVFDNARDVSARTNFSWWDCLIVGAAMAAGCELLLSEDLQHGQAVFGVRIENPFRDLA